MQKIAAICMFCSLQPIRLPENRMLLQGVHVIGGAAYPPYPASQNGRALHTRYGKMLDIS
jgi:hypothetical protein